jgi:uncharacterized protein (TIGR02117 family)
MRMRTALLALLFAMLATGCAREPFPAVAADCDAPRRLQIVSHGWHTGIVFRSEDLVARVPALGSELVRRRYLEVGWGDDRYYPAEEGTAVLALRALLWPTPSVLQVVAFEAPPRDYFARSDVAVLPVDEAGYRAALDFVARSFARTPEGGLARLGPSQYGEGRFYAAEGRFHAFNTCNTWVAQAIVRAGYPVSPRTVTARGLFAQFPRKRC